MKKFATLGLAVAFALALNSTPAVGDILFTEGFDYANGSLVTVSASNWQRHSGTTGQIQVLDGKITLTDSQSEDVNRLTGTVLTSGTIFGGFDFSVNAPAAGSGSDSEYFAHFGNGTSSFAARMEISAATGAGDYGVGISNSSSTDATWATDLTFNTTYRAIIGYDRDTGLAQFWLDPASSGDTSLLTSTSVSNDVEGFYFRESNSSINETIVVDNLVVGTTFDDVLDFSTIPEPGSWVIMGMVGLIGLARRRK